MEYVKPSALVGGEFTVNGIRGFTFKRYNEETRKYETSERPQKGFQKKWTLEIDKGLIEVSQSFMGQMTESALTTDGVANIKGQTFKVVSNGKGGKDIRYYVNKVWNKPVEEEPPVEDSLEVPF